MSFDGDFLFKDKVLTEKNFKMWMDPIENRYCKFCGYKFKVGDSIHSTFTNFNGMRGGNPMTCTDCCKIPRAKRIELWNALGDPQLVIKAVSKFIEEPDHGK